MTACVPRGLVTKIGPESFDLPLERLAIPLILHQRSRVIGRKIFAANLELFVPTLQLGLTFSKFGIGGVVPLGLYFERSEQSFELRRRLGKACRPTKHRARGAANDESEQPAQEDETD